MHETRPHFSRAMIAAILGVCAFVYANSLNGEFIWDDASSILLHEHVQQPSSILSLFTEDQHAFAGGQGNFYGLGSGVKESIIDVKQHNLLRKAIANITQRRLARSVSEWKDWVNLRQRARSSFTV